MRISDWSSDVCSSDLKRTSPVGEVEHRVTNLLAQIQADMLAGAIARRDDRTAEVSSIEEAVEAAKVGFARLPWDLVKDGGEARLAQDAITVRCLQTASGDLPDRKSKRLNSSH